MSYREILEITFLIIAFIIAIFKLAKYIDSIKASHDKAILELYDRINELEKQLKNQ